MSVFEYFLLYSEIIFQLLFTVKYCSIVTLPFTCKHGNNFLLVSYREIVCEVNLTSGVPISNFSDACC